MFELQNFHQELATNLATPRAHAMMKSIKEAISSRFAGK
jgi:hypothetical protein